MEALKVLVGGGDLFTVLERRVNDVQEEDSYESTSMRVMWTAAGEVQSLGLAFHLTL